MVRRADISCDLHLLSRAHGRYVYFAATKCHDTQGTDRRMFVLENGNVDPFVGSFQWKGKIADATDLWAIEGTVLQHPTGQLYFIWSGWEENRNVRQLLYIARMSNPWAITGPRVEIARPIYGWETNHSPHVNGGPHLITRNGVISLVYSASGSWTDDYCLGLITALVNSNLTDPASWHKRPDPIFRSSDLVYGPGHHSFTKSSDDREDWIVYHSARFKGAGWTRQIRAQPFEWHANSTPDLGFPVDPNTPIALPSGDLSRIRYEAEDARLANGPRTMPHPSASNGSKVGGIDAADSTVEFTVQCPRAGSYVIAARTGNGSPGGATATYLLKINDGREESLSIVYSGWDVWGSSMVRANLNRGANTLTFKKGDNYAEIDAVDIFIDE